MTAEHLRFILEYIPRLQHSSWQRKIWREQKSPKTSSCCSVWGVSLLQKPGGGVRGIVCGNIVRRLVARSVTQQIAPAVPEASSPFQHALTTKAGGECVAHAIQSLTDLDSRATVLSIDGIGVRHDIESCDVGWASPSPRG